jgi:hypothetical protein
MDDWLPELVEKDFCDALEVTWANGCPVEVTLKDIGTSCQDRRRLGEWAEIGSSMIRG